MNLPAASSGVVWTGGMAVADGNDANKITKEEMMGSGKTELEAPEKGLRNKNSKEDEKKRIRCNILVTSEDDHHIFMELKSAAIAASGKESITVRKQHERRNTMKNETKTAEKAGNERRITLRPCKLIATNVFRCVYCGGKCNSEGFDYHDEASGELVCGSCAQKYAPEIVRIRQEALDYTKREVYVVLKNLREKVAYTIETPVEVRVTNIIDQIYGDYDEAIYIQDMKREHRESGRRGQGEASPVGSNLPEVLSVSRGL